MLRFFNVLSLMEDIPPNLHTLVFESETPMMAIDQPLKAARMFLFRLVDNRSIRKLSLCINISKEQRKIKAFRKSLIAFQQN